MKSNKIVNGVAAVVAAAALIGTGAALSNAATTEATATSSASAGYGQAVTPGSANPNNDTPVTGSELATVTAAVKAKDSTVSVTSVRKDPDGSYDVLGTKAGADVMLEVSKDLKTITTNTRGPGGPDGRGGHHSGGDDTPVTGSELATVTAAVKAKDSTVSVTSVRKDPDGSYDVLGTKARADVMLEVGKDLKTITTNTGGPGGHDGRGAA